jgi:hypothetical protein
LACNRPGGAATVPSAPKVITGGKFAGSLIHELNDADLGEAHRACSRDDGPMQHAIAAERRRRWHAAHRARVLSRRRQSAQRRGGAPVGIGQQRGLERRVHRRRGGGSNFGCHCRTVPKEVGITSFVANVAMLARGLNRVQGLTLKVEPYRPRRLMLRCNR